MSNKQPFVKYNDYQCEVSRLASLRSKTKKNMWVEKKEKETVAGELTFVVEEPEKMVNILRISSCRIFNLEDDRDEVFASLQCKDDNMHWLDHYTSEGISEGHVLEEGIQSEDRYWWQFFMSPEVLMYCKDQLEISILTNTLFPDQIYSWVLLAQSVSSFRNFIGSGYDYIMTLTWHSPYPRHWDEFISKRKMEKLRTIVNYHVDGKTYCAPRGLIDIIILEHQFRSGTLEFEFYEYQDEYDFYDQDYDYSD